MVVLKIFNDDKNDNEKPLCTLHVGEHVFGRGSFANCIDKKIFKRHLVINVQDNEAMLTLIHIEPIFFKSSNAPNIRILKKDESIRLSDGDKFAFLIDTWYSIRIEDNESKSKTMAGSCASTILVSNPISTTGTVASTSNTKVSQSASLKRSTEALYSEERKRLKLMNENLDKLMDNIDQIVAQDFQNNPDKETSKEVQNNNAEEVYKKENVSDSDDEDSDAEMLPEVTRDTEVVTSVQISNNSEGNSESGNSIVNDDNNGQSSDILDDINKEPMVHNNDVKIEASVVKEEPVNDKENTKKVCELQSVNQISGHENDGNTPGETAEVNQNSNEIEQNPADASASSSGVSTANSVRREQCWYGRNCFRKNNCHKNQFSHPGDSDYSEISDDNRSQCPYGAQCYRTNPQHRKDFSHPTSRPATRPFASKRKRRMNMQVETNSDYDSQDEDEPFSAEESSSSSEVFGAGDSDSDYMGEPNFDDMEDGEEVEIMFKEAKRFLRKKRKD